MLSSLSSSPALIFALAKGVNTSGFMLMSEYLLKSTVFFFARTGG
jgi:hypothetical protein